jgi:plasmid maintenance system killer protein
MVLDSGRDVVANVALFLPSALTHSGYRIASLHAPVNNRLEQLKRDRLGQWSVRFRFEGGHAYDVEIVD